MSETFSLLINKLNRQEKVQVVLAAQYGAVGVAMYTDPADYAAEGTDTEDVYPHTWWLPPTGVQRGTVYAENGDPLTPGFPATCMSFYKILSMSLETK